MELLKKSLKEQLELAVTSSNENIFKELVTSPYMNVRRALVGNDNVSRKIIILSNDSVLNVSYMAIKSGRSSFTREFSDITPCVSCEIDERYIEYENCTNKQ